MAIRSVDLGGTALTVEPITPTDWNDTFAATSGLVPIGSIVAWAKTFHSLDSGTTDSTTANKLVQSGQNFDTTVAIGNIVHNTTDDTFAYVTAVDSATTLSIDSDIMISGEAFVIYATPALSEQWVECNGQTLSDAESIFDGATIYDLNTSISGSLKGMFLRGHTSSGLTETSQNLSHNHSTQAVGPGSGRTGFDKISDQGNDGQINTTSSGGDEARPHNTSVVWIMRVK